VFGDYQLALEVQALEARVRHEHDPAAISAIASAIRGRYDLTDNEDVPCGVAEKDIYQSTIAATSAPLP
jgi:hypothetical protein